ncbi:MAG: alpha-galactosidase [Caldilinea sp.]
MCSAQRVIQVNAAGIAFEFEFELEERGELELQCTVEPFGGEEDTFLVRCEASLPGSELFTICGLALRWDVPATDMHGMYAGVPSLTDLVGLPFWEVRKRSAANHGIPFAMLFHRGGDSRYAFGLIDQLAETDLSCTLSESTRSYHFHWRKPQTSTSITTARWRETIFVSRSRRPWPEVLALYRQAVDHEWPQPHLSVPDHAYDPVFCSWTAIHHDVSQEWVLRNAQLAADLGFRTWLTDDGWFTDKARFADYRYTGDWQPCADKFPDFAGHVRAVQAMGLRYVLWVGPFMVGDESWAAERYAHLLQSHDDRLHYSQLSPWFAETGAVVTELLERLVVDYRLDGLKLDFIDAVTRDGERPRNADYGTLGEGVYETLCHAVERIAVIRPGLLIELRSRYTNLAGRRYGNLYRASDVPINFAWNRWQAVMLRLLAPDRAVHLDPAIWHPDDTDENVAVHLINLICSVPMVSIELEHYPQSHIDLIRTWIAFYQRHRSAIVHSRFEPVFHLGHVPLIRFIGEDECIVGLYDDVPVELKDDARPIIMLNASARSYLQLLPSDMDGPRRVREYDRYGRCVSEATVQFPVTRIDVEIGGRIEIDAPSTQ